MYAIHNLNELFKQLDQDIVLTPHALAPYPDDNFHPSNISLFNSGHINGGIVFMRRTQMVFKVLDWLIHNTK